MSKWGRAIYCFQMPTVDVNILWDSAACCCQIALILPYAIINCGYDYSTVISYLTHFVGVSYSIIFCGNVIFLAKFIILLMRSCISYLLA